MFNIRIMLVATGARKKQHFFVESKKKIIECKTNQTQTKRDNNLKTFYFNIQFQLDTF